MAKRRPHKKRSAHERGNRQAEELVKELESPFGAQKLGDEAYETAMQEQTKARQRK